MKRQHNIFLQKVAPEIIIHLFKNKEETAIAAKLSRITGYAMHSTYENIKKLKDLKIIKYPTKITNKVEKPFKLTQKGEEIAVYLMNMK